MPEMETGFGLSPSGQTAPEPAQTIQPNAGPGYGLDSSSQPAVQPAGQAVDQSAAQPAGQQAQGAGLAQQVGGQQQNRQGQVEGQRVESRQAEGQQAEVGNLPEQQLDPEQQPITDFSKVDLRLGNIPVDQNIVQAFGKLAQEQKLTPAQARALAHWQAEEIAKARDNHMAAQTEQLKSLWGNNHETNRQKVNALCARLDRLPGLEKFSEQLAASGAANNATVVHGLLTIAQMLAEDSKGKISGSATTTETALEGLRDVWRRARGLA